MCTKDSIQSRQSSLTSGNDVGMGSSELSAVHGRHCQSVLQ